MWVCAQCWPEKMNCEVAARQPFAYPLFAKRRTKMIPDQRMIPDKRWPYKATRYKTTREMTEAEFIEFLLRVGRPRTVMDNPFAVDEIYEGQCPCWAWWERKETG